MKLTVSQMLQKTLGLHNSGDLQAAERLYRAILKLQPRHADANHNLGVLLVRIGKLEEALPHFKTALESNRSSAQFWLSYMNGLMEAKKLDEAQKVLHDGKKVGLVGDRVKDLEQKLNAFIQTRAQEQMEQLLVNYSAGNYGLAESQAKSLAQKYPSDPFGWKVLGAVLQRTGRLEESLLSMRHSVELAPNDVAAHCNLGNVLKDLGRLNDAETSYRIAIRLQPNYANAHFNLGNTLRDLGRLNQAGASYRKMIRLKPGFAPAHNNLGNVLRDLGSLNDAEQSYREAIRLKPDYAQAHYNLGNALTDLGRLAEAETSYWAAISLKPDNAEAHGNLGKLLMRSGRYDLALASFNRAFSLNPNMDFLLGEKLHCKMMLCDWENFESELESLKSGIEIDNKASVPFAVLGLVDCLEIQLKAAKTYVNSKYSAKSAAKNSDREPSPGKIRIGYYSADFHNHATAYLMAELFENHDFHRFEIHGFSFGPDKRDRMRTRVRDAFNFFHEVSDRSGREIAQMSRDLGIDIAIDLKGFTLDSRTMIFAERAAPVQVSYLGYPGTMGAPYVDYIIADRAVIPEESKCFYTEKVVYLPHSYQANDSKRRISDKAFTRYELGLPDEGFVFCCFNNNYKILPATFDSWMRILKAVEGSVLWLFSGNPTVIRNLRDEAEGRGVDPSRLVFAPRMNLDEHLARQRLADLFVDTNPYNAHTTASDALWVGLPVLTCVGRSFASRVAASLLQGVGLPELITESQDAYEAKAIALAKSPATLAVIRAKLEANRQNSPLFNGELFAKYIESAYIEMHRRYHLGLQPAHLAIKP